MTMARKFILLLMISATLVAAQTSDTAPVEKILTVEAVNGSKQSGVISYRSNEMEPSILVAIIPGHPVLARASVDFAGKVMVKQEGSFVVRERLRLVDKDIATLVIDCRSDFWTACDDNYQMSEQRYKDILPLMELAKNSLPSIKQVWLLSTSRGYFTSVAISKYSNNYFSGVIHTAGVVDMVAKYPEVIAKSATPQFFIHHADDPCKFTQYSTAKNIALKVEAPILTVFGGSGYFGGACMANTQHGFKGMEEKVMAVITQLVKTGTATQTEIR